MSPRWDAPAPKASEIWMDFFGWNLFGSCFFLKKNGPETQLSLHLKTNKKQGLGFSFKKGVRDDHFPRKIDWAEKLPLLHWIKLASYHLSPSTAITSNRKMPQKSPNHSAATRLLDKMHFFQQQKHHTPIPCFFTGGNGSTVGHSVPLHKFRNFTTQQFFPHLLRTYSWLHPFVALNWQPNHWNLCASLLSELPLNKWSASCQFAPQALIAVLKVTMLFGTWCNDTFFHCCERCPSREWVCKEIALSSFLEISL